MAAALAELRATPVVAGYLSAAEPTVTQALSMLYGQVGPKVAVANYLLAPGVFFHRLTALAAAAQEADRAASGASSRTPVIVSTPLAPHPLLARIALQRYDEALATAH